MRFIKSAIFLWLLASFSLVQAQIFPNLKPTILGQVPNPLRTQENVPITISLSNLTVIDLDDLYPIGFKLTIYAGKNFQADNLTITPNENFHGMLTVPVSVNDGQDESRRFDLRIQVTEIKNVRPVIADQLPLSTNVGASIAVQLTDLIVNDPDNKYPDDFTLKLSNGPHFKVKDNIVTPDAGYQGTLTVPTTVHDGESESPRFNLRIAISEKPNVAPVITGNVPLAVNEDQFIDLKLTDLLVTDPDNSFPADFTLKIFSPASDANYTVSDNRIMPKLNFTGTLLVTVSVTDGKAESNTFDVSISVNAVNDAPKITGQKTLTTSVQSPITVALTDLTVTDPDNKYPDGFGLKIENGSNYIVDGPTITPIANFKGTLHANITVNDGALNSNVFDLQIRVIDAPNVAPTITGQIPLEITENTKLTVSFGQLIVTDPDNPGYPKGFTLAVLTGTNYTVSGTTITPTANFKGMLSVRVTVNDGTATSPIFNLQVSVIPKTVIPQIIGQNAVVTNEDEPLTITSADLIVSDADDSYPTGFTLQILAKSGYTINGATITPAKDLNGFLAVSVAVTDDSGNQSKPFNLAVLVNPVNDAPVITQFEDSVLSYEPGRVAIAITEKFEVQDVDNDYLSFAEVSIARKSYVRGYDELNFSNTATIRGVFDLDSGKLSLIGYATLLEYQEALRSVTYKYNLSDEEGTYAQLLPGPRTIAVRVYDGQAGSEARKRTIEMETNVTLKIPTAFTPNGDGPNERWQVTALSNAQQCDNAIIKVYNKSGLLLFQAVGIDTGWDGVYNGEILPTDTYYYTIDLKLSYTRKTYRGVVTILR